jgi:hypothetical protein
MPSFVLWGVFVHLGPLSELLVPQEHINLKQELHPPQIASRVLLVLTALVAVHILIIVPMVNTVFV